MSKIAVIGGGAAGLIAAYFAAFNGHNVTLFKKMRNAEKKFI